VVEKNNKLEVFLARNYSSFYLLKLSVQYPDNKEVFITDGPVVLTNSTSQPMQDCDQEEVNTRLIVHLVDALKKGLKTCLISTVDINAVVILIGKFSHVLTINFDASI